MIGILPTLLLLSPAGGENVHRTLRTPHYQVQITERCGEVVGCDDVLYESISTSGKTLRLRGKQIEHMCPGMKNTPCHPIGYEFRNGSFVYFVGEDGILTVKRGSKVLFEETGTWIGE